MAWFACNPIADARPSSFFSTSSPPAHVGHPDRSHGKAAIATGGRHMTSSSDPAGAGSWNYWRVARWTVALALLLTPLVMMQISEEWHWTIGSFLLAGIVVGVFGLLYELAERASGSRAYRAGVAVALAASFMTLWTTVVRDDGNGIGFFLLIMAAAVGSFAAWFGPAGMART